MTGYIGQDYAAHQDMAKAVGAVMLTWAAVENALVQSIAMIDQAYGPIDGHPELPRSLVKQIAFLKAALHSEPRLDALKESGIELTNTLTALKKLRNDLTHGMVSPTDQNSFVSVRYKFSGRAMLMTETRVSIEEIAALLVRVTALEADTVNFAVSVLRTVP